MSNDQNRPKLKPNLSNVNYGASSSKNYEERINRQPQKRSSSDTVTYRSPAKRFCHGQFHPPSNTRNLAQRRLNNLRHALQMDILARQKNTSTASKHAGKDPEATKNIDEPKSAEKLQSEKNSKEEKQNEHNLNNYFKTYACSLSETNTSSVNNNKRATNDTPDEVAAKRFVRDSRSDSVSIPQSATQHQNVTLPTSEEYKSKESPNIIIGNITTNQAKEKYLCIVVDTNVFISDLLVIQNIIDLEVPGAMELFVYIPWMVITELDEIKDRPGDTSLTVKVRNAIKCIHNYLSKSEPRIRGQTVSDMSCQPHVGLSQDDKIIGTCLQALERYEFVILLSNDINLRNKAMINDIPAASSNEIISEIISVARHNTKYSKIIKKLGNLCSSVICECANEAYGNVWLQMDMLSNPPWTFLECLNRFEKYWTAVFQEKLMKQFKCAVNKLTGLLGCNQELCDESGEYNEFVKLSLDLCIFLKDLENFSSLASHVIDEIMEINSKRINT